MKTLNYVRILFLLTATISLISCGDKYYDDEYLKNSDAKLCRTSWIDEWVDEANDDLCIRTLVFTLDGRGTDKLERRRYLGDNTWSNTIYNTNTTTFDWKWIDNKMEGLRMDYATYVVFFDNVWVREHYLSGKLDGVHVTFVDAKIY